MDLRAIHHDEVDSTSERAFEALRLGTARNGDTHLAASQSAGRGRLGRRWHSAPGEGLYLSVVLLPPPPGPTQPAALTMAAGLAVLEVARGFGLRGARLKWPNDVLVHGAKLAGILVESRGYDRAAPHFVVGVGLNVAQREFPAELLAERPATSLALEGAAPPLAAVEAALLGSLGRRLAQGLRDDPRLCVEFEAALELLGAEVAVHCGDERHLGRLAGIDLVDGVTIDTGAGARSFDLAWVSAVERAGS
ncbi:biotin--[acetyl-CoA-carboxylase] ligase [Engelhardtia mirabilis]|uniref:Bifunctional ligase/repressor BirA n=1 Tax=Engelhardtia mirabilis TaxID=2528011 RepID=A0A518BFI3_9BACT|nr:Bifunctional ligase/repressor BirA [Planctomycetes bacterium Pla133]QDV00061.1 Bifunctional ligase/repressor BirA [Planctomycetes bacterium Pla86]